MTEATASDPTTLATDPERTSQTASQNRLVWIIATAVVFGWGINFVFAKHALNQFDLATFNAFRFTGMTLLGWIVITITGQIRPIQPQHRKTMVTVALVGFVGYIFGFSVGLNLTSAFSASLLLALAGIPSKCGDFQYEEMSCQRYEESTIRSSGRERFGLLLRRASRSRGWRPILA